MTKTKGRPTGKTAQLTEIFTRVTPEEKKRLQAAHKQYNKDKGLKLSFSAYLAALVAEEPTQEVKKPTLTERTYEDNALWALLPKKPHQDESGARSFIYPVKFATSQDRSSMFDVAGRKITAEMSVQFIVPNAQFIQIGELSDQVIAACKGNKNAIDNVKSLTVDNLIANIGLDLGSSVFGHISDCKGEVQNSIGDSNKLFGIEDWIPFGGPQENDNFCGVNRTIDPVRLAGNYLDATQLSIEDVIMKGTTMVGQQGGSVDTVVMPYAQFAQFLCSQAAKIRVQLEVGPGMFIDAIEILTVTGRANVIPDPNCPLDRIYGINLKSWTYYYLGTDPVMQGNMDGHEWYCSCNSDCLETRFFSMGNLVCTNPKRNFVAKVTPQ